MLTNESLTRLRFISGQIGEATYWAVDNEFADPYKPDVAILDAEGDFVCLVKVRRKGETYEKTMKRARCIAEALTWIEDLAQGRDST